MKEEKHISRRKFISTVSTATAAVVGAQFLGPLSLAETGPTPKGGKLALLGGKPVAPNKVWPKWPYVDEKIVARITDTVRSGKWCRIDNSNGNVTQFEHAFADLIGAKGCVCTGSGTQSLHTVVEAMGFGPGDEIITSPYTDMGTIQGILAARVLPVLADIEKDSFQIDPEDVERKITSHTVAIMPIHIMGQPCNMGRIMEIAEKHHLRVIEDACQAHLAEYKGKKVGTIGDAGCFSFQSSKVISCGEGGGITSNDLKLLDDCYTVQNHGTNRQGRSVTIGPKYRMNELEAAILLGQMEHAKEQNEIRNRNARYLYEKFKGFQGLVPQKLYEGTTNGSFYLYTWSFRDEYWDGITRDMFLKAVAAEGIGLSPYIKNGLHREPWTDNIISRKSYQAMYSPGRLQQFKEELTLPNCDWVCAHMVMLWASGPLLAETKDMDDVVNAVMKVYENRKELAQK
ncbi:MAG: DegT/DnrJ/EryC1/StrS family aminotransferase [Bacteroidales bacterium]|nr:DegT/DnrJ/EryC1/StrS family aminotransferase [Bacteroidales bacterium]MDY6002299.1 DegT/DnrJ/EryC1/StrS family aminotransferase [Candidatus Cryptobacteroides sp.]